MALNHYKNKFIFDLDGVLTDTHDIQCKSTIEAIFRITQLEIENTEYIN